MLFNINTITQNCSSKSWDIPSVITLKNWEQNLLMWAAPS